MGRTKSSYDDNLLRVVISNTKKEGMVYLPMGWEGQMAPITAKLAESAAASEPSSFSSMAYK